MSLGLGRAAQRNPRAIGDISNAIGKLVKDYQQKQADDYVKSLYQKTREKQMDYANQGFSNADATFMTLPTVSQEPQQEPFDSKSYVSDLVGTQSPQQEAITNYVEKMKTPTEPPRPGIGVDNITEDLVLPDVKLSVDGKRELMDNNIANFNSDIATSDYADRIDKNTRDEFTNMLQDVGKKVKYNVDFNKVQNDIDSGKTYKDKYNIATKAYLEAFQNGASTDELAVIEKLYPRQEKEKKPIVLGDGQMLIDENGDVIKRNTKDNPTTKSKEIKPPSSWDATNKSVRNYLLLEDAKSATTDDGRTGYFVGNKFIPGEIFENSTLLAAKKKAILQIGDVMSELGIKRDEQNEIFNIAKDSISLEELLNDVAEYKGRELTKYERMAIENAYRISK